MKTLCRALLLLLFIAQFGVAQQNDTTQTDSPLRRGFRDLRLGLNFIETQTVLRQDDAFAYRGEPDVSLRLSDSQAVIDVSGRRFVERAVLQFRDDRLYIITLYLDGTQLDYFQLFTQLSSRYGDPVEMDPNRAYWEDERTRITLERPLRVQYVDRQVFEAIRETGQIEETIETQLREDFLDEF